MIKNNEDIDYVYWVIIKECKKYHYDAYLEYDTLHIKTKFESWKLKGHTGAKFSLYHGNGLGKNPKGYHLQFRRYINPQRLVRYLYDHETYRYRPFRFFDEKGVAQHSK